MFFTGVHTSQVVQDFFHQQYVTRMDLTILKFPEGTRCFGVSSFQLYIEVEKFGRIDILINNASALWWQRRLCALKLHHPGSPEFPCQDRGYTDEQI